MIFEFIITYQPRIDEPIVGALRERLREALEANLNDVDDDALACMVQVTFERVQPRNFDSAQCAVLGFSLELPDETASIRETVDDFADALAADPIKHAIKCEDPLLRAELATRATELFAIEMKLRRVLSIIYLHAYPDADAYDLLREETMQPMASARPRKEQMAAAAENQFFHLTFGQYVGLNQRPAIKDLTSLIKNKATYEAFREELMREPVEHEDDASFLASLKSRMDSIEKMRNAVAHNRRPSKATTEDYLTALPLLNQALDDYLSALAIDWEDAERADIMPWKRAAQEAVAQMLDRADWREESNSVWLYDLDDDRMRNEAHSRDELAQLLRDAANTAFFANCPRDDGEFLEDFEDDALVAKELERYADELSRVFQE